MAHPGHKKKTVGKDPSAKRLGTYQSKPSAKPGRRLFGRAPASATPTPSTSRPTLLPRNKFGRLLETSGFPSTTKRDALFSAVEAGARAVYPTYMVRGIESDPRGVTKWVSPHVSLGHLIGKKIESSSKIKSALPFSSKKRR